MGLAETLGGELLCCDSVQIYRGFVIGSAAPTTADRQRVPHHLYGDFDPAVPCDAGHYARTADARIEEIRGRGRRAIVVGGAGLYLRALLWGLAAVPPVPAEHRRRLTQELEEAGAAVLFARLQEVDPASADRIQGGAANTQRVLRALEVYEGTGKRLSVLQDQHTPQLRYEPTLLVPSFERPVLFERIDARVERMFEAGFVTEVRDLLEQGLPPDSRAMASLGYKEVAAYLRGERGLEETKAAIKRGHRRYAKRQGTWFRKVSGVCLIPGMGSDLVDRATRLVSTAGETG
jgi:tRNA dimethylallyltransferase